MLQELAAPLLVLSSSVALELRHLTHMFCTSGTISSFIYLLLQGERKNGTTRVCIVNAWRGQRADFWSKALQLEGTCKSLHTKWPRGCFRLNSNFSQMTYRNGSFRIGSLVFLRPLIHLPC